jgi:hypothetical protein
MKNQSPYFAVRLAIICLGSSVLVAAAGPSDILVPVGLVVSLVFGGIGYGVTKNQADSAHKRVDALDARVTKSLGDVEAKLDRVIRLAERIDERTAE